jgi:hypothetical protein
MTLLAFSGLLLFISYFAGMIGAIAGLGGGVIIIPALVLLFHVNILYAMGAALISVMVTSSGAAVAYLREGYTNLRIGMFLETGAILGAFIGIAIIKYFSASLIAIIFGLVLLTSAYLTCTRKEKNFAPQSPHPWATALKLEGTYNTPEGIKTYTAQNVPLAWIIMIIAGTFASLLGIGSGALKVLAMDQAMHLPYKVSSATSNFIIGITAAVSAGVYFSRGYIDPVLCFPVAIGVLLGATSGARILNRANVKPLRIIFSMTIFVIGLEMIYQGFAGNL